MYDKRISISFFINNIQFQLIIADQFSTCLLIHLNLIYINNYFSFIINDSLNINVKTIHM